MADDDETPDVVVEVSTDHNEPEPEPVVDEGDTIVVVAPEADDSPTEGELERAVGTAVEITELRGQIEDLWRAVFELQSGQLQAEADAEQALDVAEDAEDEVVDIQDEIDSEIEPESAKTHPLFRPLSEWRGQ